VKKLFKRAVALGLALAAVCAAATSCGRTPIETIEKGAVNLAENVCEEYSVIRTLSDALSHGSVQINLAIDDLIDGAKIKGADGSVTMYFGGQDMAVNAAAKLNGVSVGDATLYMNRQGIAVSSDAFFGSGKAYGSDYDGIDDRFEASIFAGDGKYGSFAEPLSMIVEYLALAGRSLAAVDDLKILWSDIKGDIYMAIEANTTATVEKGTYTANGKSIKTHNVVITAEEDQISDALIAAIEVLLKSDKFLSFCKTHDDSIDEIMEYFAVSDSLSDLPELLEELKGEIEDNSDFFDSLELEVKAYIGRSSKELLALEIAFDDNVSDDVNISLICTPSSDKLETVKFTVEQGDDKAELTYEVKEDTKDSYKSKLTVRSKGTYYDGEEFDDKETFFEYSWNKSSGDFKLQLMDEIDITGKIEAGKKSSVISIEKIKGDGEEIKFEKLEIVINASDNMPVIDSYEDIMTISEDDFEKIYDDITDLFQTALGN